MTERGLFEREKNVIISARALLSEADESQNWIDHYRVLLNEFERLVIQSDRLLRIGDIMQARLNTLREDLRIEIENHKRTQAEKESMQAQLFQTQKMEALGTLVGGIAHDINNMLQSMLGFSELMLQEKKEDDPSYRRLQAIIQTGRGGADLVKKLLAFSQQATVFPVNLDLNDHITDVATMMSSSIPTSISIDIDLCKEAAIIHADPTQIDDIIMNLIMNAIEAMPEGGELKIVSLVLSIDQESHRVHGELKPGNYVMLSVSDTGRGMDESTLSRIFEPFFSTKQKGASRGTGLGLSVVKGIVESQGGHITCKSLMDRGTEFKVFFPIAELLTSTR